MGKAPCGRNWTVGNSRLDKRVWQLDSSWKQSWNSEATIRRNVLGPYASMDVPWFCLDMTPSPLWNHGVPKAWRVPGVSSILSDGLLLIVPRPGGQTQTPIAQPPQMHKQTYIYILSYNNPNNNVTPCWTTILFAQSPRTSRHNFLSVFDDFVPGTNTQLGCNAVTRWTWQWKSMENAIHKCRPGRGEPSINRSWMALMALMILVNSWIFQQAVLDDTGGYVVLSTKFGGSLIPFGQREPQKNCWGEPFFL